MEDLEIECLGKLTFTPIIYKRFMDDGFSIIPSNKIDEMITIFNEADSRIKFTYEVEKDGVLNFLDIKIIRNNDGSLSTNWYQKPTYSGRYLNYFSSHPVQHKRGVVNSLVDRAILLSDRKYHSENLAKVKQVLSWNCYPSDFVENSIKKRLSKLQNDMDTNQSQNVATQRNFIVSPYVKGLSERI